MKNYAFTRADLFNIMVGQDSQEKVVEYLMAGKFFSVDFIKRTNGQLRTMHCRARVRKYRKMGKLKFKPSDHNLLLVYDLRKRGYRMVAVEGIKRIRAKKVELVIC